MVSDLRRTALRYAADRPLQRLISELTAHSSRFAELWESEDPGLRHGQSERKVISHPAVGRITLDCDTLFVATDDVRINVYTAEPGTEDAERLALALVLGPQELVE